MSADSNRGNPHLVKRLAGILSALIADHDAGASGSAASKGRDRETFIREFLQLVLPPPFRFGTGEITDRAGLLSGQLDIVVEYPLWPSVPINHRSSRLYLAEGVAAAIEVKSDLAKQWSEVEASTRLLRPLRRGYETGSYVAPSFVPIFAVGYGGWKTWEPLQERVSQGAVDGILILDPGLFCWNRRTLSVVEMTADCVQGPLALWAFVTCLCTFARAVHHTSVSPFFYARPELVLLKWAINLGHGRGNRLSVAQLAEYARYDLPNAKAHIALLVTDGLVTLDDEHVVVTERGRQELAFIDAMVPL